MAWDAEVAEEARSWSSMTVADLRVATKELFALLSSCNGWFGSRVCRTRKPNLPTDGE